MKYFKVYKPAFSDEDAEPVAERNMLIVCDGLGATGQNKHEIDGRKLTSAYWGSRCVSDAAKDYISTAGDTIWNEEPQVFFREFKAYLDHNLRECISLYNLEKTIKGKSAEFLPTTFAMAVFKEEEDFIRIFSVWAGDSRVYLLSAGGGLQQISEDDVEDTFDAMESLGTSNMCNNISGEGEDRFYLNYKQYKIEKQPNLFLFAASDGCFDYLSTPMDFEYLLELAIDRLTETDDISLIETKISEIYSGGNLLDDTTMAGVIFNETGSEQLRQQYKERFIKMKNDYRQPTESSRQEIKACENDINMEMQAANKALRDLGKQVVPYACSLLDGNQPKGKDYIKEEICNLPCMAAYRENMRDQKRKIDELQFLCSSVQQNIKSKEEGIKDSFQKEYIPVWIRDEEVKKSSVPQCLKKLVQQYRDKEKARTDFYEDMRFMSECTSEKLRHIRMAAEHGSKEEFFIHVSGLRKLVNAIEKNGKIVLQKEQNRELYQSIVEVFKNCRELDYVFENAKKSGFIGFSETMKLYKEYKHLENKEDQYAEEINSLTNNDRGSRYISSLGNVFVNEFINMPHMEAWMPEDMCNKIEEYKQMCRKQEELKRKVDAEHEKIDCLWRETYKDTYELYNTVCGGRV